MFRISKLNSRKSIAVCLMAALVIITVYLFLVRKPHTNSVIPSSSSLQTAVSPTQPTSNVSSDTAMGSDSNAKFPAPTQDTNATLLPPSGTFVSNHRPSLSGSAQQLEEQSVCSSTTGASCLIRFSQGSVTKALSSQVIGATGTAYWNWNIKDSGLTEGTWSVEAVATHDGQEKTTNDSIDLVILR